MNNYLQTHQDTTENTKLGYEILEKHYEQLSESFYKKDEKLNMFLVFNAAILVLLTVIFPIEGFSLARTISFWVIFGLFSACMLLTILTILVAIYPRRYSVFNEEYFAYFKIYDMSQVDFLHEIIEKRKNHAKKLYNAQLIKVRALKITIISTIINLVFILVLLLIKMV